MNTMSLERKKRYRLTRLGWPLARARTGVECIRAGLEASSSAPTFEALRRGTHTLTLPDIPGTSSLSTLRAVLGNPDPGLAHAAEGRGVLQRLLIGDPLSGLPADGALLAEDAARVRRPHSRATTRVTPGQTVGPRGPTVNGEREDPGPSSAIGGCPDSCTGLEGISGRQRLADTADGQMPRSHGAATVAAPSTAIAARGSPRLFRPRRPSENGPSLHHRRHPRP